MTKRTNRTTAAAAARPTSLAEYRARTRTHTGQAAPSATAGAVAQKPLAPYDAADLRVVDPGQLRAAFAAAAGSDARGAEFHRMVAAVLDRAGRVAEPDLREWHRFLNLLDRHRTNPKAAVSCAVLANLVGIAAFGDDSDFVTLEELTCLLGTERVAAVQHRSARFVEPDLTYPITTIALRRMVAAPPDTSVDTSIRAAVALLLEGVDPDLFLPVIRTQAELLGVVDGGSVLEWRHHLAMIAASPWSPYSRHLAELATEASRPGVALVVDHFTQVCREQNKEREREQVAEEVRRVVSSSGVTQRQFAQWVGTSPSRLSTYLSGTVTPSASLMLRMTRTSRLLQERDVHEDPSTRPEQSWGAARTEVGGGGSAGPTERVSGPLGRGRSHLSAV